MYSADKPIDSEKEDLLGRAPFAKQLGRAILSDFSKDNMVIGLFGKWGSGKTSIINIALQEIEAIAETMPDDQQPIVMKFSPWNFTDNENLICLFFEELKEVICVKDNKGKYSKVGELLENYSDALEFVPFLPGGKITKQLLKDTARVLGRSLQDKGTNISVERAKKELEEALREQKHRIIVVIDDIDRLSNEQIRTIFQLVKQVAGLPNMTYLLSMDREIVSGALETVQKCDGQEYLEKIVQLPFDIPQIDIERVQNILLDRLQKIYQEYDSTEIEITHWNRIYHYCIRPFVKSVRDVNRIVNVFQFKYAILHSEVNFSDLLALTVLSIYVPRMAEWIARHKSLLCEGADTYLFLTKDNPEKNDEFFEHVFAELRVDQALGYRILTSLFPVVARSVTRRFLSMGDITDNKLRKYLRVAANERFDVYFKLDSSSISVKQDDIKNSVFNMEEKDLTAFFLSLNEQGKMTFYLEEFQEYIPKIPPHRIKLFIKVLLTYKDQFSGGRRKLFLMLSDESRADFCIEELFAALNSAEETFQLVLNIIKEGPASAVAGLAHFILLLEEKINKIKSGENITDRYVVSNDMFEEIKRTYSQRLVHLVKNEHTLFDLSNLNQIAFVWRKLDQESFEKYFKAELKNVRNILKYIVSINGKWHSSSTTRPEGWAINANCIQEYVSEERNIYDEIKRYGVKNLIKEYDDSGLQKIATFLLNEKREDPDGASLIEAQELVDKWKRQDS